ncbi:hypothetical protein C0991_009918, partial [Blastosporella zonata]
IVCLRGLHVEFNNATLFLIFNKLLKCVDFPQLQFLAIYQADSPSSKHYVSASVPTSQLNAGIIDTALVKAVSPQSYPGSRSYNSWPSIRPTHPPQNTTSPPPFPRRSSMQAS